MFSKKRLNSSSKVLKDKVHWNKLMHEFAIKGLQSNLTKDVEMKEVAIKKS